MPTGRDACWDLGVSDDNGTRTVGVVLAAIGDSLGGLHGTDGWGNEEAVALIEAGGGLSGAQQGERHEVKVTLKHEDQLLQEKKKT